MICELKKTGFVNPIRLINSIVRWIQGVSSPGGTIKIQNTIEPSGSASITFDINREVVQKELTEFFDKRYCQKSDVANFADETGIHCTNDKFWIDKEWIIKVAAGG